MIPTEAPERGLTKEGNRLKKHPILKRILIDILCAGLALTVFALFHHVLPREQQSLGIVIENPYRQAPSGDADRRRKNLFLNKGV